MIIAAICLVLFFGAALGVILHDVAALANVEITPAQSTIVYGDDGKIVAELYATENRTPVKLEQIPEYVRKAFIAIEDNLFYTHHGVSFRSVVRAVVKTATGDQQGASTITMQLAKMALTGSEQTWTRKIKQTLLAFELERKYTKDEILEMYLNWAPFGHGAYGVQAAARVFFGKDIQQVNLAEAAMMAGVTNLPGAYSPYLHFDRAKQRQELVLDQMVKYNMLSKEEAEAAKKVEIKVRSSGAPKYPGGYFTDYVLQQLLDKYGADRVYAGGLRVYTTVNIEMQNALEKAMADVLDPLYPIKDDGTPHVESAGVFIDPHTGYIKALAGGRKYDKRLGLNRAVQSYRQPGSAFKPIAVYAAALDLGMSPSSLVDDSPKSWPLGNGDYWTPRNYDNVFKGLMTLREAVADSRNLPAAKTLDQITPEVGYEYAMKLGKFKKLVPSGKVNDKGLSLALGGLTVGVSPLELTAAYGAFANGGVRCEPLAILKVTDKNGNVLEENTPTKSVVLSEETAYLMTNTLQSVVTSGTGKRADLGRPTAGKTGTTTDLVDAWWVGYTPEYVGAVWMGYDEPKRMSGVAGGGSPALIWKATMQAGLKNRPVTEFPVPENIVTGVPVCSKSGELPGPNCPPEDIRTEVFRADRVSTQTCTVHVVVRVCADHPNRLASPSCPNTMVRVMTKRPVPYVPVEMNGALVYPADWANEAPTVVCEFHGGGAPPTEPPSGPPMP
ncbi:MAG: transglycosylase domain-containing protein [Chloroflexota bacterium]